MKTISSISVLLVLVIGCQKLDHEYLSDAANVKSEEAALIPLSDFNLTPATSQLKSRNVVEKNFIIHEASGTMKIVPCEECSDIQGLQGIIEGTGHATHTGLFSVTNTWCVVPEGTSPFITGIITAANGDEIQVVVINYFTEDEITTFQYLITGGTGRFEGAEGSYVLQGTVDWANGVFDLSGEGVIVY